MAALTASRPSSTMPQTMSNNIAQAKRRLSSRRGSISASDPYGKHSQLNMNPNLSSSSTLTIVRVSSPTVSQPPINLRDPPSSPVLNHRRNHRRHGSGSSVGSNSSQNSRSEHQSSRLSFAFSSFGGSANSGPAATGGRPESPTQSRARPASPTQTRQSHSHSFSKPRLSPEQLVDLAKQATNPRYSTPSPSHTPTSHSLAGSPGGPLASEITPASFTPLADDVWLPFIDRPGEVSALITTPPSAKLFSLLAQTFPHGEGRHSPVYIKSARSSDVKISDFPSDPTTWTFTDLHRWLTQVPRATASDVEWIRRTRACILTRSELIWERVKGALGVPPELDIEDDEYSDVESDPFAEWDTTAVGLDDAEESTARASDDGSDNVSDSPVEVDSEPENHPLSLSIENIISPSTPSSMTGSNSFTSPPPLSLPSSLGAPSSLSHSHSPLAADAGLGNISEDQEVEEENEAGTAMPSPQRQDTASQSDYTTAREAQPLQGTVQGLKISTTPLPSSPLVPSTSMPAMFSPSSSPSIYPRMGSVSSSPSFATHALPGSSPRNSFSNSPLMKPRMSRTSSFGSVHSTASSAAYDPVGDRVPGNPLFPSNFARLAAGPTLRANNPSLRSPTHPPAPAYPFMRHLGAGKGPPSWLDGWDPSKQEYAVTIGSGSSVQGD